MFSGISSIFNKPKHMFLQFRKHTIENKIITVCLFCLSFLSITVVKHVLCIVFVCLVNILHETVMRGLELVFSFNTFCLFLRYFKNNYSNCDNDPKLKSDATLITQIALSIAQ
jgi:hypothetical protein